VLAHVFKVVMDPFIGKVGVFRVHQGTFAVTGSCSSVRPSGPSRSPTCTSLQGKDYVEVPALVPGDIGAVAKVEEIEFDSVLHDSHDEDHIHLKPLEFPKPMQGLAVETRRKGDEQRLFEILHKLELEDPCFKVERHPTERDRDSRPGRDAPARQAHAHAAAVQAGARHQPAADCLPRNHHGERRRSLPAQEAKRRRRPVRRGDAARGAAGAWRRFRVRRHRQGWRHPRRVHAAVEKGVRQALADGVVAGFPVHDIRVTVYDGKTHAVDGKDIAFVSAGRKATIEAIRLAKPMVLEPLVNIEVLSPEASIGDLTGDLASKRGQVTGTQPRADGNVSISGLIPLAELDEYQGRLKSLTGGKGSYSITFSHYAQVPAQTQQQLASNFKAEALADD
jgi:elongation factor G